MVGVRTYVFHLIPFPYVEIKGKLIAVVWSLLFEALLGLGCRKESGTSLLT